MKLLDRIATLLRADAHGVVESLEERSLLLKQYVREAEIDLDHKRARQGALREEEKVRRESLARTEDEARALDEDVSLALSGGKEEIARFAIRRLLPRRAQAKALGAELTRRAGELEALAERVATQEKQLEDLRVRVRGELARGEDMPLGPGWLAESVVAEEEVELELLRRRGAAEGRPS